MCGKMEKENLVKLCKIGKKIDLIYPISILAHKGETARNYKVNGRNSKDNINKHI